MYFQAERGEEIIEKIWNSTVKGCVYNNLGVKYSEAGDFNKALEYNELYLSIAKDAGDKVGEGRAYSSTAYSRIPALMACTSSNAVDMIDVLPLPKHFKVGGIRCMKEDNLYVIQCYNNANNKTLK